MLKVSVLLLSTVAVLFVQSSAYRILGVFPLNGRSHDMMFSSLMEGLAKRGHKVDVVTHFPPKHPPKNYKTIINLSGTMESLVNNFTIDFVLGFGGNVVDPIANLYGNRLCDLMGLEEFQQLIHHPPSDPPYDIFITEVSFVVMIVQLCT